MRGEFKYQAKTPRPSPYPSKSEENFLRKKIFGTSVLAAFKIGGKMKAVLKSIKWPLLKNAHYQPTEHCPALRCCSGGWCSSVISTESAFVSVELRRKHVIAKVKQVCKGISYRTSYTQGLNLYRNPEWCLCVCCSSAIDLPYFHSSPLLFLVVKLSVLLWLIKGVKRLRSHNRTLIWLIPSQRTRVMNRDVCSAALYMSPLCAARRAAL